MSPAITICPPRAARATSGVRPPNPRPKDSRIPVKDRAGEILYWVTPAAAQRLINAGSVEVVGTKNRIRALLADPAEDQSQVIPIAAYQGQHYSHDRETERNPAGVWTHTVPFARQDRGIFLQVVADCLKAA